ncbi:transglycosylase domain-containing protein [Bacillus cihuensis]|uniref:transglycosylase domain-containing protein n=1 Tax=Bacillus cihuensis TaxID=1208599 RepID=UPI0004080EE6|nr:PBP1A family penicillin-binding protein [Bacillus cihuensis]
MELITGQRFKQTRKYIRAIIMISAMAFLLLFLFLFSILIYAKILGPPPIAVPQSTIYYSDNNRVIGESSHGQKRYWEKLEVISPHLINATIAVEDRQFFTHHGFDLKRIAGAIAADIRAMSKVQGASTITQQYARSLFLENDKTWSRKLNEAFYTIRLELNYSKEEILEGYLNTIYYGHGAYGVQAASQYYFGKNAKDLSLAEASMLAGIPKGPTLYSPLENFDRAKNRQQIVLTSMIKKKFITNKQANEASSNSLLFKGKHLIVQSHTAPYFQDAVKQALKSQLQLDERTIELGGLRVYTTLNERQQQIAEKSFATIISADSTIQGALVAMNPETGAVQALVGGRDYQTSPFNRATQAVRQPGSTIKPLLYYAALENGYTPSTMLKSEKTTFNYNHDQSTYTPSNYNHQYANDEITLAQAIALSDNIYAVKTLFYLGLDSFIHTIHSFGITTEMKSVPSLALGTSGIKAIEMVNAYSILANGGKRVTPIFIKKVENAQGEVIFEQQDVDEQVLDADQAFVMTQMLTGVFDEKLNGYAKVTGNSIRSKLTRTYAGKSGSTSTDSWMIGYTPKLVSGVWIGYDKGNKLEKPVEKGYAKTIWADFMENSVSNQPVQEFKETNNVIGVYIDPESGKLATPDCLGARLTYFVTGTEPKEFCSSHGKDGEPIVVETVPLEKKKPWYKRIFKFGE